MHSLAPIHGGNLLVHYSFHYRHHYHHHHSVNHRSHPQYRLNPSVFSNSNKTLTIFGGFRDIRHMRLRHPSGQSIFVACPGDQRE